MLSLAQSLPHSAPLCSRDANTSRILFCHKTLLLVLSCRLHLYSMFKAILFHNGFGITRKSTTSRLDPLLWNSPFTFSLKFLTTTTSVSDSHSFVVSYLVNNFGFSPEFALKASKQVRFKTSKNPDSVLNFFRNHGFTDSDILNIIKREPWLLSCDPQKRVLPKFQFLLSIGASTSDIVRIVLGNPRFMQLSLKNRVIPIYKLVNKFLRSDEKTLASIISCPSLLYTYSVAPNVKFLVDNGVGNSSIVRILRTRPKIICSSPGNLGKTVQELKDLEFDPSKSQFGDALLAKRGTSKSKWNEKIDTFKRWGWSEEKILEAIRRQPKCMLVSNDKINRVMRFWVNELGWDSAQLVKAPGVLAYALEKRVVPRASVVHYLLSKGLISETASLVSPFFCSEKLFLQRYVTCFNEEETFQLMKLYLGKMNAEDKRAQENLNMSIGKIFDSQKSVSVEGEGV